MKRISYHACQLERSGREFYANCGIIGIEQAQKPTNTSISEGYDGSISGADTTAPIPRWSERLWSWQ